LADAIRHHHDKNLPGSTLQCCLYLADQLSQHPALNKRASKRAIELPDKVKERFGGNIDEILVKLGDLSNVVAEAQAFAQTSRVAQS
jgi:hypothetical protein